MKLNTLRRIVSFVAVGGALVAHGLTASAVEYPIGKPHQVAGMQIAAVYLQPVVMEPEGMMRDAKDSDMHLEADISGLASNPNGIPEGAWVPYLMIGYQVTKAGSSEVIKGDMMPMVANDGPHYGDNVKLSGPGQYHLKLDIAPPSANKHMPFGRHIDRQTGVAPWFKPFSVEYDFVFAGIGKKGGY